MEFEPGGVQDLRAMVDRLIPVEGDYEHNRLNHDSNSHAHQRASIFGALGDHPDPRRPSRARHLAAARPRSTSTTAPRERTIVIQVLS